MRKFFPLIVLLATSVLFASCHSSSSVGDSVTNMVIDNTVGTASDSMTNVDATIGAAANMTADVGEEEEAAATESADNSSESEKESAK